MKKYVSDDKRLMKEWDFEKNLNLDPKKITIGSGKKVSWVCEQGHEWNAVVCSRAKDKKGCPYCSGRLPIVGENDLATTHPHLVKEWHPTKNGNDIPENFKAGSHREVSWLCENGHEWEASIQRRASGSICPYCSERLPIIGENDLATTHPHLAKEWHSTKNGSDIPKNFKAGSNKEVYWQCEQGHEWKTEIYNRAVHGSNCPYCSGRLPIIGENDLATTHPHLAKEWHPTKNEKSLKILKLEAIR